MIAQVIFRIRQPKAYRPLTNDNIKWFEVDHTSATDISLRRPAPEVSVRSTCCIRQKTKKAEKMNIKNRNISMKRFFIKKILKKTAQKV